MAGGSDRVGANDEVALRIKRPPGTNQKIQPVMGRADRGQDEDDIVIAARTGPVRDIADLEIANGFAALEKQIAERLRLMRAIDPAGLQVRMPPARRAKWHSHLLTQQDLINRKLQDGIARSPSFRSAQVPQRSGVQPAEDIATHQLTLRERTSATRRHLVLVRHKLL